MTEYNLQAFASDTLATQLTVGGMSFTLASGNFTDTPAGMESVLTIEPLVVAKKEIITCTISGTTVTITARGVDGTSDVQHEINAPVIVSHTPTHYNSIKAGATAALVSGWQNPNETWAYASASTITVPSGATAKYAKGDKLKLNQVTALTSYWSFDTNSSDAKGAATMADIGTPTYTAGKFGNALTLNGTNQALAITDAAAFKPTGAFTVGCWLKATADANSKVFFSSFSDNTNANGIYAYVAGTTGFVTVEMGKNDASPIVVATGITDVTGDWHYIVISYQGNFVKLFVDGVLESSGYMATPTYAATNYVRIGCENVTGTNINWFKGQIDDLFFINGEALSEEWVVAKYAAATAQGSDDVTMTKYFYVTAVADTVLTITGGADFALSNSTITANYYSKVESPVGFPQWMRYIPTWSGGSPSIGNGSIQGKFIIKGRILEVSLYVAFSTTTSFGTGANVYDLTVPVTAKYNLTEVGSFIALDSGTGYINGTCRLASASTLQILCGGNASPLQYVDSDYPVTWANGDFWIMSLAYEI